MTKARDNLTRIFLICWQHLQDAAPNNNNNSNNMCSGNNNNCSSNINYNLLKQQQLQLHQQQQQQLQLHQQQQQQQQAPHESSLNVEAVILQNQVDTLHWQLKQVSCPAPSPTDKRLRQRTLPETCDMRHADESWLDAAHFEQLELCKVSLPLPPFPSPPSLPYPSLTAAAPNSFNFNLFPCLVCPVRFARLCKHLNILCSLSAS